MSATDVVDLARLLADHNYDGQLDYGALHLTLADYNLEDGSVRYSLDNETSTPPTELEREIIERLLKLTEDERAIAIGGSELLARKRADR